ncbi:ECF transporter S component [Diplocloster modestus]|uniref:Riboflavin transporter n=1 Tax=Diplocloster modestus TaxID=2850322 RepID=A0ABS6K7E4_9FIRM|nr:ECF transporter S component [Diplocloster modestus]MBU9726430.1 ECF transporter S component [Diplocloster modestus]
MSTNVGVIKKSKVNIRTIVQIGMLSAIATVLMLFEIPLPFMAPSFYELDFSEVPVLIGCFAMGPIAGVLIELVKILLNLVINGTITAGVGEAANFLIGCAFILPAGMIYKHRKSRKTAIIGMAAGTVTMTILGCFLNAYVLLPAYASAFGWPLTSIIEMGSAINPVVKSLPTFVILMVAPFNILKGVVVSLITFLLYKYISPILHRGSR